MKNLLTLVPRLDSIKLMRADKLDAIIGAAFFSALLTFVITADFYRQKADESDRAWNESVESAISAYLECFQRAQK